MARIHKPSPRDFSPPVMCGGKRRYASKQQATIVKDEQELLTQDLELNVYRCQAGCGGWHLTRSNKKS